MARPGKPAELLEGSHMRYEEPADIAELEKMIAPFAAAMARLDEIPGVGTTAAPAIITEVGLDMSASPRCPPGLCTGRHPVQAEQATLWARILDARS